MEPHLSLAPRPGASTEGLEAEGSDLDDLERMGDAIAAADALLDSVEEALARLDQSTYGTCDLCDQFIADGELETAPTRKNCESCLTAPPDHEPEAEAEPWAGEVRTGAALSETDPASDRSLDAG
jgi:RNA polymerase-binding transcription factor DksA